MTEQTITVPWSTIFEPITLEDQLDICRNDIGTKRQWQPVTIHDEDGPAAVVALCHPCYAPLIASAPELLARLEDAALQLERLTGESLETYAMTYTVLARAAIARARGQS